MFHLSFFLWIIGKISYLIRFFFGKNSLWLDSGGTYQISDGEVGSIFLSIQNLRCRYVFKEDIPLSLWAIQMFWNISRL